MAERTNPFHYGSPAAGVAFADREEELADIVDRMLNGQNVILLSPRRYGKTSLLLEAIDQVKKRRGRSGYASLLRCSNQREVAEALLNAVLNGPLSWLSSQSHKLAQVLGRVRLRPTMELDPSGSVRASLAPSSANVDWQDVISTTLRLLSEAEGGKRPVSLVLDEFQRVAEIDEALPAIFKVMADELRDVSLVFAGSKMHVMGRLAVGPAAPLLGIGERITMGPVPEDKMAPFLRRRARQAGKAMSDEVARLIFDTVDGIPNDVQRLAYEAFFVAEQEIDAATVRTAAARIVSHRALDYEESFNRLSPAQQRLLKALAREPTAAIYARRFLDVVDVANASTVRKALDVLTDLELVAKRGPTWVVSDAFFRSWLASG